MTKGKFISFEGGEGSGKSTQAKLLSERLGTAGIEAVLTREPGGSPFAERLRGILLDPGVEPHSALSEALLFSAARADHLEQVIRPGLAAGRWILCDRFMDSTRAYQGYAGTVDPKRLEALELLVVGNTRPDLTIVIDLPAEIGLARAAVRRGTSGRSLPGRPGASRAKASGGAESLLADRYEGRDIGFHKRLRDGFLDIAAREPGRCAVVDGRGAPHEVAEAVWSAVEARLRAGVR